MELTFGDGEGLGQRKRTRRELFLEEMEQASNTKIVGNRARGDARKSPIQGRTRGQYRYWP